MNGSLLVVDGERPCDMGCGGSYQRLRSEGMYTCRACGVFWRDKAAWNAAGAFGPNDEPRSTALEVERMMAMLLDIAEDEAYFANAMAHSSAAWAVEDVSKAADRCQALRALAARLPALEEESRLWRQLSACSVADNSEPVTTDGEPFTNEQAAALGYALTRRRA